MKRYIFAAVLALIAVFTIPTKSKANGYLGPYGVVYGNICRNGMYYQAFLQFAPVGTSCFMPAWNAYGIVTTN